MERDAGTRPGVGRQRPADTDLLHRALPHAPVSQRLLGRGRPLRGLRRPRAPRARGPCAVHELLDVGHLPLGPAGDRPGGAGARGRHGPQPAGGSARVRLAAEVGIRALRHQRDDRRPRRQRDRRRLPQGAPAPGGRTARLCGRAAQRHPCAGSAAHPIRGADRPRGVREPGLRSLLCARGLQVLRFRGPRVRAQRLRDRADGRAAGTAVRRALLPAARQALSRQHRDATAHRPRPARRRLVEAPVQRSFAERLQGGIGMAVHVACPSGRRRSGGGARWAERGHRQARQVLRLRSRGRESDSRTQVLAQQRFALHPAQRGRPPGPVSLQLSRPALEDAGHGARRGDSLHHRAQRAAGRRRPRHAVGLVRAVGPGALPGHRRRRPLCAHHAAVRPRGDRAAVGRRL